MSAEERETLSLGLARGHSLRMMAPVLGRAYPDDMRKHLSPETIYVGLSVLPRGALGREAQTAMARFPI